VKDFAEAMISLFLDPSLSHTLGQRARKRVEKLFSSDCFAADLQRILEHAK